MVTDYWLSEHFREVAVMDVEDLLETRDLDSIPIHQIHVLEEHPHYSFEIGNIVAVVSSDADPFWLAQVTAVHETTIDFTYYHHNKPTRGNKMIWKLHSTTGSCGVTDVYTKWRQNSEIFTKNNNIRKQALKKISNACLKYNNTTVPDGFQ